MITKTPTIMVNRDPQPPTITHYRIQKAINNNALHRASSKKLMHAWQYDRTYHVEFLSLTARSAPAVCHGIDPAVQIFTHQVNVARRAARDAGVVIPRAHGATLGLVIAHPIG